MIRFLHFLNSSQKNNIAPAFFTNRCIFKRYYATIYAVSSGSGKSGVAAIRVSGKQCSSVITKMTKSDGLPTPKMAILRTIHDPETAEALHRGPRSFTGEDVCELHVHGSKAVIRAILLALSKLKDFMPAKPGSGNDDPVQFTSKSSSETDVTKRNTAVSVDDATCKRVQDDEQYSPVSKRNKNSSDEGSSEAVTSALTRSRVVVFDIDNTLCYSKRLGEEKEKIIRKSFPECPMISWYDDSFGFSSTHLHVFLPHLKILFDYLLKQGVRIVFFSSAPEKRNQTVIPKLLTSFWGSKKFEALKAIGQFDIFSEKHLRKGCFHREGEGNKVKDLKVVIRDGETLLDAILVEDDPGFCAHDQRPYLYVIDLMFWHVTVKDKMKINRNEKSSNFQVNNIYYMLGVFKTYFENEKYKVLPLREGLDQLLPKDVRSGTDFYQRNSFADDMINLGLSEVQKLVPDAMYY